MHAPTRRTFLGTAAATCAALTSSAHAHDGDEMPTRPNILFLYPDQHRYDWLGDGSPIPVRTPHLDALARLGVRFTQALTPSPLCAPARACLAAGKEYDRCRVPTNGTNFPLDQTTVYTLLRKSGYHVMGCGKFDLHKASPIWGIDGTKHLAEWGFSDGIDNAGKWDAIHSGRQSPRDPYMHYLEQRGLRHAHVADFAKRRGSKAAVHATSLPDDAYCDNWIGDNGIQLLRRAPMGRPWFLQVNFTGPHDPWDITQAMSKLYDGAQFPPPNRGARLTPQQHNAVRQNYSAMVGNIDRWLGRFVTELRNNGELDNTLIVFSSDHGEMLGDHGRWGKCMPFQPSVGVPLVVAGPGVRKAHVCHEPTTTLDLTATFLQAAGLEVPKDMDSRSLLPLLRDDTDKHRDHVLSGLQGWRLVFDGRYKLIRGSRLGKLKAKGGGPALRLFDLKNDPHENHDLADEKPGLVARLSKLLEATTRS